MARSNKMKPYIFIALIIFFPISGSVVKAAWNKNTQVTSNTFSTSTALDTDIKLNEFMADPIGNDKAPMPDGEWVELYNVGNWSIDVGGWYLYDSNDGNDLVISATNVVGGSTIISAKSYLVVYRNNENDFSLNNNGDTLRLYNGPIGLATLIDSYIYDSSTENQTWARVPDGTGTWQANQTPSPGATN